MFNRYVDGLATLTPTDHDAYDADGPSHGQAGLCPTPNVNSVSSTCPMSRPTTSLASTRTLIDAAKSRDGEYSKIWDLFAFQPDFTIHLARFTQGVLRQPATISPACASSSRPTPRTRTSVRSARRRMPRPPPSCWATRRWSGAPCATSTTRRSRQGQAAAPLRREGHQESARRSPPTMLRRCGRAGWDDEAIYFAITTCALFNFYNRWITATGVPEMSPRRPTASKARSLAARGYITRLDRSPHDATHITLPDGPARHPRPDGVPARDRQAAERAGRCAAARSAHAHARRAGADRDLRLVAERLPVLPDHPRRHCRAPSRWRRSRWWCT